MLEVNWGQGFNRVAAARLGNPLLASVGFKAWHEWEYNHVASCGREIPDRLPLHQVAMSEPRVVKAIEAWNFDTKEHRFEFYSVLLENQGNFYCCKSFNRPFSPSSAEVRELFEGATLVPGSYYLGQLPPPETATRAAPTALSDPNVYFKKITPYMYDPELPVTNSPALDMMREMQLCEELNVKLQQNPSDSDLHLCRYLGYLPTPDGNHLWGLCFERHQLTLSHAVRDKAVFDPQAVIDGVRRGLERLHSLGYAHNDINPANIMLNSKGFPVIIDFDGCCKIGDLVVKGGTPGFELDSDVSSRENDFGALAKVQRWLEDKYTTA
ncbi:hypothetical protein GGX14DRAFT_663047 [Mycena pura]|uniref:Protein kinase domain-containing protein n=1 Tax=Mycena pura TaxID=153505 RepID=A0AAD6VTE9_9AGAR|nr:hypothetical protein GGX14DRAFT_663047 [Mycena pura]